VYFVIARERERERERAREEGDGEKRKKERERNNKRGEICDHRDDDNDDEGFEDTDGGVQLAKLTNWSRGGELKGG